MTSNNLLTHDRESLRHALIQLKVWSQFIDGILRRLEIELIESVTLLSNSGSTEALLWITPNLGDGNRPTAHVCIEENDLNAVRINKIADNQYQLELWGPVGILVGKYGHLLFGESSVHYVGELMLTAPDNIFTDKEMVALIGESAVDEISGEGSFHCFDKHPDFNVSMSQHTQDIFHGNPACSIHKLDKSPFKRLINNFDLKGVVVHRVPNTDTYLVEGLPMAYCRYLKRLAS